MISKICKRKNILSTNPPLAADGGRKVADLHELFGQSDYQDLLRHFIIA